MLASNDWPKPNIRVKPSIIRELLNGNGISIKDNDGYPLIIQYDKKKGFIKNSSGEIISCEEAFKLIEQDIIRKEKEEKKKNELEILENHLNILSNKQEDFIYIDVQGNKIKEEEVI